MMQLAFLLTLVCTAHAGTSSVQATVSPIEKVIEMLSDLQQKIIGEGEASQKVFDEFGEWCEEESKNLGFDIKTAKSEAEDLTATINKADTDIAGADEKIGELSGSIATDEADVKAATAIRDKEHGDFVAEEKDLVDTVDTLERAISIIEREMQKGGASLMQLQNAKSLADSMRILVAASAISSGDASRLNALVQTQDSNDDEELGAPDPAAYKNQSGGIVEVLSDLLSKAQDQLAEARKTESDSQNNYNVLKLELEDAIKFGNSCLDKEHKAKAAASEIKAVAEGDLAVTMKSLGEDGNQLAETHHDCMTKASDFELETASRAAELKALATAKKIIKEMTGGAASQSYGLVDAGDDSFLQVLSGSRLATRADLANFEAVKYVKALSRRLGSTELMQLANQMSAAARLGASAGDDPFAKVKGLISEMIEKLLKEAEQEAAHKGYCDKEMSETKAKKEELTGEIAGLNTKIDKMTAESAQLKEEVAVLGKELADLAKSQAEMNKLREEEHTAYVANKAEMEQGLEGIKLALKVLREYYSGEAAHGAAAGAGGGIIGMLEVIESDFSKGLAEMNAAEDTAQAEFEKVSKENEISKVTKEQDVKYKTKEAKGLDKATAEATGDRTGLQTELDAVLDYWEKIKEQCIAKAEPYAERKKRREAEISGLKEALSILDGEAVLLQSKAHRSLRHVAPHSA